ncbi:hypothetical protein NX059_009721 [Plenodomus lindquistii]|nr:hypothetical protein NX059_009721 [Plenodomus lindquistii]
MTSQPDSAVSALANSSLTLPLELRNIIYSHLEDWLFQPRLSIFGLASRDAYKELLARRADQLKMFFEAAMIDAANRNAKFMLHTSLKNPSNMADINRIVLIVDDLTDLPLSQGLLRLNLSRLEIHLLKPPQTNFTMPINDKADFACRTLKPVVDAAGALCNVKIKTIVVTWCMNNRPHVYTRRRFLAGRHVGVFPGFAGEPVEEDVGVVINTQPVYKFAMTDDYETGRLVLRSETRWKPNADWMRLMTESHKREVPEGKISRVVKEDGKSITKSTPTELEFIPLSSFWWYKDIGMHQYLQHVD